MIWASVPDIPCGIGTPTSTRLDGTGQGTAQPGEDRVPPRLARAGLSEVRSTISGYGLAAS